MEQTKQIRFVDQHNNEIFRVSDGGYVGLKLADSFDGSHSIGYYCCTYIDEKHFKMDSLRFHHTYNSEYCGKECADNGGKHFPVEQPPSIGGYTIWETETIGGRTFMIGFNPNADKPYLVCQNGLMWRDKRERYFSEQSTAYDDLRGRLEKAREHVHMREKGGHSR